MVSPSRSADSSAPNALARTCRTSSGRQDKVMLHISSYISTASRLNNLVNNFLVLPFDLC